MIKEALQDRELIRQYREYDEDRDPGQYRHAELIKLLSKAGSQNSVKIEEWISKQEVKYGLAPATPNQGTELETERKETSELVESLEEDHRYIKQVIAETNDSEKRDFFQKLLKYEERRKQRRGRKYK